MKLTDLTMAQLCQMLKNNEVSSQELTKSYINNIQRKDGEINAYLFCAFEQAMQTAKAVDEKIEKGENYSPLAGIPCAIKDNICTKGIKTTCASKMLENFVPSYDAHVVERLKANDVVMLGKLNMDEFSMGSTTENSFFKTTKNPRNLSYVPGGSSGGSAAAVAANEAVYTLGSDTGGSIRQPAAFCGVVGMKPTYGTVSRNGLIAFASSLDQIGPLTKDVRDNALVLNAIQGYDQKDSTSKKRHYKDCTCEMENDIQGMKIALPKEYFKDGVSNEVLSVVLNAAKEYEKFGATISEVSLPSLELALPAYYILSSAEASSNLARFDGIRYGYRAKTFTNLEELYKNSRSEAFGKEVKRRIMLGTFALSAGQYDAYYAKALQVRTLIMRDFFEVFTQYDCILAPVARTNSYKIGEITTNPLDMYKGDIYTVPVNIAGLPALSLPLKQGKKGLPLSMQLIGKAFSEATLYRLAYAFEKQNGAYHLQQNIEE